MTGTTAVHKIEGIRITQKRFRQGADRGFWVTSVEVEGRGVGESGHTYKFFSSKQLPVTLGNWNKAVQRAKEGVTTEPVHFINGFAQEIQEEE